MRKETYQETLERIYSNDILFCLFIYCENCSICKSDRRISCDIQTPTERVEYLKELIENDKLKEILN